MDRIVRDQPPIPRLAGTREVLPAVSRLAERRRRVLPRIGLAGRLIILIAVFVMCAQVMIFIPAVTNMRFNRLRAQLDGAAVAALAFERAPPGALSPELSRQLLRSVGARLIVLDGNGTRRILASRDLPAKVDATFDLRSPSWTSLAYGAFDALTAPPIRVLTYLYPAIRSGESAGGDETIEVTLDERPLQRAMYAFARRILTYSLIASAIVATLAALAMHRMILRPVRRLTTSIMDFGADPGDRTRIIEPSGRAHEIGQAERALAVMQEALALELAQKKNLANLGLAVAKINHDMRNMLAAAQILSDRLANLTDPLAQRLAPKLVATLDRAIRFCQATLTYGRAVDEPPQPRPLRLRPLVAEAAETASPSGHGTVRIVNEVPDALEIIADAEQMFRVMLNLLRNGVEALERAGPAPGKVAAVDVRAWRDEAVTVINVTDTGPGVPAAVRATIFSAFQNSSRPGGTGLGLAIVADLIRAHGGTIALAPQEEDAGASFRITLPVLNPLR